MNIEEEDFWYFAFYGRLIFVNPLSLLVEFFILDWTKSDSETMYNVYGPGIDMFGTISTIAKKKAKNKIDIM